MLQRHANPLQFRRQPLHIEQEHAEIAQDLWPEVGGFDLLDVGHEPDEPSAARGEPLHRKGVTDVPGLYFLGLPWLSRMNSSFMSGVGEDAVYLADHIAARQKSNTRTMPAA